MIIMVCVTVSPQRPAKSNVCEGGGSVTISNVSVWCKEPYYEIDSLSGFNGMRLMLSADHDAKDSFQSSESCSMISNSFVNITITEKQRMMICLYKFFPI